MPLPEKIARNIQIYKEKTGITSVRNQAPTNKPISYRKLSTKYGVSVTYLQEIVNRMRKYYAD